MFEHFPPPTTSAVHQHSDSLSYFLLSVAKLTLSLLLPQVIDGWPAVPGGGRVSLGGQDPPRGQWPPHVPPETPSLMVLSYGAPEKSISLAPVRRTTCWCCRGGNQRTIRKDMPRGTLQGNTATSDTGFPSVIQASVSSSPDFDGSRKRHFGRQSHLFKINSPYLTHLIQRSLNLVLEWESVSNHFKRYKFS